MRELAQAAAVLSDRALSAQLLDDLHPLARACGVNGAVVACHAHTAGLLAAALDHPDTSRQLLQQARALDGAVLLPSTGINLATERE